MSQIYRLSAAGLLLLLACTLSAQTLRQYETAAREAFEREDYNAALSYNQLLLELDSTRTDALYPAAVSAQQLKTYPLADRYYTRIADAARTADYADTDYRQAQTKRALEQYDQAAVLYERYLGTNPANAEAARRELDDTEWALAMQDRGRNVEIAQLDEGVNTTYSDFAPRMQNGVLYYTSVYQRPEADEVVTHVYTRDAEGIVEPLNINAREPALHTAHSTFSASGDRIYYTICEAGNTPNDFRCDLYYRDRNFDGDWAQPNKLPGSINQAGTNTTQPAIGVDENGREILFFSSNRPGGAGGLDLYASAIDASGSFGAPQNLTALNTAEDELSPYFNSNSQTLYFASKGHRSLGGFDNFRAQRSNGTYGEVENLGAPLNSSYDDTYYSIAEGGKAYFASNRPGALCAATDDCCVCNDIYEATMRVDLNTLVYNGVDSTVLTGVTLELVDPETGEVVKLLTNADANDFYNELDFDKDYVLRATKDGYAPAEVTFNTKGINETTTLARNLYLTPQVALEVYTYDAITRDPLNDVAVVLTDLTAGTPRPERDADGHEYLFPLAFDHDYRVTGNKDSYTEASAEADTRGINVPTTLRRELYLAPFSYIPLTVYFDNDYPGPDRMDTTINVNYMQTFDRYYARKEEFVRRRTAQLPTAERAVAAQRVRDFFENDVAYGARRLQEFSDRVLGYLQRDAQIELIVEGYASPLAPSDYNRNLTKRRIHSVENYLREYDGGKLAPYLDNGQLRITEQPRGETTAPESVPDSPTNRRRSVYGVQASQERRVRILDVRWNTTLTSLLEGLDKSLWR